MFCTGCVAGARVHGDSIMWHVILFELESFLFAESHVAGGCGNNALKHFVEIARFQSRGRVIEGWASSFDIDQLAGTARGCVKKEKMDESLF